MKPAESRTALVCRSLWTSSGRARLRRAANRRVLWLLAGAYRKTLIRETRIAAVIGSFGKSTTTRALCAALGLPGPSHDNWNAGAELAASVLRIPRTSREAVLEVGISGPGQMKRAASLLQPSIAVVTSIGSEHLTSLGSLEATRDEKAKMLEALPASGLAVLNGDDSNVLWMRGRTTASILTCGFGETNDVRARDVSVSELGAMRFQLLIGNQSHGVETRLMGRHMIYSILAAAAVAGFEGRGIAEVLAALEQLEPTPNRLQPIRHGSGAILVLDAFKGALETIEAALDTVNQLCAARKVIVLGEVEELQGKPGDVYRQIGNRAGRIAMRIVFVGGKRRFDSFKTGVLSSGLPREALIHVRENPLDAARIVEADLRSGDVVLVKGRRTQRLERIALALRGERVACTTRFCQKNGECATCRLLRKRT